MAKQSTELTNFINKHSDELVLKVPLFLLIFDFDGVFTSTERVSHFASWDVLVNKHPHLKKYNMMDLSDLLFGIKVVNQQPIIEQFFQDLGENITITEDFGLLRDETQLKMLKNIKMINGIENMLYQFKNLLANMSVASRSRAEPFFAKAYGIQLEDFIFYNNWFLPTNIEKYSPTYQCMQDVFTDLCISTKDQEFDKVEIFSYTAASLEFTPKQCIVIEDSVKGIISAQKAGMIPFCFTGAEDTNSEKTYLELMDFIPKEHICETADELLLAILKFILAK